jgi:MFS family permease
MSTLPEPNHARRLVFLLCLAEALSMAGFAAYPTFLSSLREAWRMSATEAGFIGGAFFFGYMAAVPFLSGVTDRLDARAVFVFSCGLATAGTAGFAWIADGVASGAAFQALAGAGLAGTYMPGLKVLTDRIAGRVDERRQGRYIAFYTATFGIGTSLSLLAAGWLGAVLAWRDAVALLAAGPIAAGLITLVVSRPMTPHGAQHAPWLPNFPRVLAEPALRPYIFGYAVHCWELFGLRSWLVAFIVFAYAAAGASAPALSPAEAAALINLIGLPASILGNEAAGTVGRTRWIAATMAASSLLCWLAGFSAGWPWWLVVALLMLYLAVIMGDSAALTAGMVAATPLSQRGAAMALYSFLGFGAGFVSPLAFGAILDAAGTETFGWGFAFGSLGVGCLVWSLRAWRSGL